MSKSSRVSALVKMSIAACARSCSPRRNAIFKADWILSSGKPLMALRPTPSILVAKAQGVSLSFFARLENPVLVCRGSFSRCKFITAASRVAYVRMLVFATSSTFSAAGPVRAFMRTSNRSSSIHSRRLAVVRRSVPNVW